MSSLNRVFLMGNITREPQSKTIPSGTTVCELGIAVNRKFKAGNGEMKEEVCFVDLTAFGRTGEVIAQYFTKGKPIFVEGRLSFSQWEAKDGSKRSKLSVVVESFQFVGEKSGGSGSNRQDEDAPPSRQQPAPRRPAPAGRPQARPAAEGPYGDDSPF